MTEDAIVKMIKLANGLIICVIYEKFRQQDPEVGDLLEVKASVCLPGRGSDYLHKDLVFGERFSVCNLSLVQSWGVNLGFPRRDEYTLRSLVPRDTGAFWRHAHMLFAAETWEKALANAKETIESELRTLVRAVEYRHRIATGTLGDGFDASAEIEIPYIQEEDEDEKI